MRDDDGWTSCHFCGELVKDGVNPQGESHWLSDCRPDLVEHDPGMTCTWPPESGYAPDYNCYAHQNRDTREWEPGHKHFYKDGPMG